MSYVVFWRYAHHNSIALFICWYFHFVQQMDILNGYWKCLRKKILKILSMASCRREQVLRIKICKQNEIKWKLKRKTRKQNKFHESNTVVAINMLSVCKYLLNFLLLVLFVFLFVAVVKVYLRIRATSIVNRNLIENQVNWFEKPIHKSIETKAKNWHRNKLFHFRYHLVLYYCPLIMSIW